MRMNVIFPEDFKRRIQTIFGIDDYTIDILNGEINRDVGPITFVRRYPFFFYIILAVIGRILFFLKGVKRNISVKDEDYIFVSCPDPIFRTRNIGQISKGLHYCILFLPNFHLLSALYYSSFFKKNSIKAYFPTVRLNHIAKARRRINKLKQSVSFANTEDVLKILSTLSIFAIYNEVMEDCLKRMGQFKGKWILEHQKFYFISVVDVLRRNGIKSTMLQHGVFFEPFYDFIPLFCDTVLCCSEREKQIYCNNGVSKERVLVFGAPLQTLQVSHISRTQNKQYDLLVLMTIITDNNIQLIKNVLSFLKDNYNSILIRMRPRSRKNDEEKLKEVIKGFSVSKDGRTISDDILSCKKAISFSVDANIELTKYYIPFIYIWDGGDDSLVEELNCATKDNYKEEIQKLMTEEFYSTFSKEQYKQLLGETDVAVLNERFVTYIKN